MVINAIHIVYIAFFVIITNFTLLLYRKIPLNTKVQHFEAKHQKNSSTDKLSSDNEDHDHDHENENSDQ